MTHSPNRHGAVRTGLTCSAIVTLAWAVMPSWGIYTPAAVYGTLLALTLAFSACLWRAKTDECESARWPIAMTAILLSGTAILYSRVLRHPAYRPEFDAMLPWLSAIGFIVIVSLCVQIWVPSVRLLRVQLCLLFLSGAALRCLAILASPNPSIDVYIALRDAPAYLLSGENPYIGAYDHPYVTELQGYDRYPFYPPLPFVIGVPFRAVGIDIRYANVLCDVIAAWVLLRAGRWRGNVLIGVFAAGGYLHFPRAPFVLAEAWYEPVLAAAIGGGLYLIESGRRLGFVLVGIAFTGKQYGPVLFAPILSGLRAQWKRLIIGTAVAGLVIVVPFVIWNPRAFIEVVLLAHLERPMRPDAITVPNLVSTEFDLQLPRTVWWAVAVGIVVAVSLRAPHSPLRSAMYSGTALLGFVLFHTQGFVNYFYLCAYLLLLGIVGYSSKAPESAT